MLQLLRNLLGGLRIALSLRVAPGYFSGTPISLTLLAALDFLLNLAVSFLLVGEPGVFVSAAIPAFFFHIPLFLFFGYLAGRILATSSLTMAIPVAFIALSIPIELCHAAVEWIAQQRDFNWLTAYLDAPHYYRFFSWWAAAAFLFLLRIKPAPAGRRVAVLALFLVLVALPLWYLPRSDLWSSNGEGSESGELHLTEQVLSAQPRLLDGQLSHLLPGVRGQADLYFVGFAGDGSQDVFLKEVTSAARLFNERFGTSGRTVILANNPRTAATLPFATDGNLQRALARVGEVMNRDEDILFLYLTSHGSKEHELAVNNRPLELQGLTPAKLGAMLKESGIRYKVVVVSACFSGGFIDDLKDSGTMIITAADATHESFGCGNGENFTWFGEAFINQALRQSVSFTGAFDRAREIIAKWEEEQAETPSNPQIWMGKEIERKLAAFEKRVKTKGR